MTLLSVIIPTFRRGSQIEGRLKAYLSTLMQGAQITSTHFECIVVDDHSCDGTFEFLERFVTQYPTLRCIQMPTNVGPGLARDAGVKIALGRWIWFLDDDDILDDVHITSLLTLLRDAPDGVDLVSHSLKHKYQDIPSLARRDLAQRVITYREHQEVFRHVFRKSLLTNHQIQFSRGLHEDIPYVVRLLLHSAGIHTLPQTVVHKQKTDDAITAKMSIERIDGYLNAYNEIRLLLEGTEWGAQKHSRNFLVQTLGVILLLITREPDKEQSIKLLTHLGEVCFRSGSFLAHDINHLPSFGPMDTNFEYAFSVYRERALLPDMSLLDAIAEVFETRLSCKDLDSSLFLGPDEIRACCKRFFVNGVRKGDVVLMKAHPQIDLSQIQMAKQDLISRINSGSAQECAGCPYIERRPVRQCSIDYLSLENFAYCNMRCTYCSPKYYGGTEAKYNAAAIVGQVARQDNGFEDNFHVVWGGGEPTLSPHFDAINGSLTTVSKSGKIRILSNSLKYSKNLESRLRDRRFHLVTSIDAGTEATFGAVRGKGGLVDVVNNLVAYQQVLDDPRRITIKYIIGPNNYSSSELQAFVSCMASSSLLSSLFQVSCDFTLDAPEDDLICALYELALRLLNQGASIVFFDDLVRDRVRITSELANRIQSHLAARRVPVDYLWTPESQDALVLWGVGKQSQWLTQHTASGQAGRILKTVQDASGYRQLLRSDHGLPPIFPAGVQSMYEIIRNIEGAGLQPQLARGILL